MVWPTKETSFRWIQLRNCSERIHDLPFIRNFSDLVPQV